MAKKDYSKEIDELKKRENEALENIFNMFKELNLDRLSKIQVFLTKTMRDKILELEK